MEVCPFNFQMTRDAIARPRRRARPPRWRAQDAEAGGQLVAAQLAVQRLQAELAKVEQQRPGDPLRSTPHKHTPADCRRAARVISRAEAVFATEIIPMSWLCVVPRPVAPSSAEGRSMRSEAGPGSRCGSRARRRNAMRLARRARLASLCPCTLSEWVEEQSKAGLRGPRSHSLAPVCINIPVAPPPSNILALWL
eukprot:SAG31_NODE_8362_length_1465_cov_3.303075_1_plen_194_part_10